MFTRRPVCAHARGAGPNNGDINVSFSHHSFLILIWLTAACASSGPDVRSTAKRPPRTATPGKFYDPPLILGVGRGSCGVSISGLQRSGRRKNKFPTYCCGSRLPATDVCARCAFYAANVMGRVPRRDQHTAVHTSACLGLPFFESGTTPTSRKSYKI